MFFILFHLYVCVYVCVYVKHVCMYAKKITLFLCQVWRWVQALVRGISLETNETAENLEEGLCHVICDIKYNL